MGQFTSCYRKEHDKFFVAYSEQWQDTLRCELQNRGLLTLEAALAAGAWAKDREKKVLTNFFWDLLGEDPLPTPDRFPLKIKIPRRPRKVVVKLEFFLRDLGEPEWRLLDGTVAAPSKELRPYVQASLAGTTLSTMAATCVVGGSVDFANDSGLFFEVPDDTEVADEEEEEGSELSSAASGTRTGMQAIPLVTSAPSANPRKSSSQRSPSKRRPEVQISIYDKRGFQSWIRGNPLIGAAKWQLSPCLSAAGVQERQSVLLMRDGKLRGQLDIQCSVLHLQDAKATIAASAKHSLLMVTSALLQLLQAKGGITALLKARPEGVRVVSESEAHAELRRLKERICHEDLPIQPDDSGDEIWFGRLSDISRQFLDFVAQRAAPDADVPGLIVKWMLRLYEMTHGAFGGASQFRMLSEQRLRRFLASAQLNMEDPVPVDEKDGVDASWRQLAARCREGGNFSSALASVPEECQLGAGAFGSVWRARNQLTGTRYAVKNVVVPRRGIANMGQRESEVVDRLCTLPHRCIVELFHFCHFPEMRLYCFVMELCPGGNLKDRIWQERRRCHEDGGRAYQPHPQALHWIGEVLLGMEHLHGRMDMLVRDLKAENVVFGAADCAKITDFGLCRFGKSATGDWTFGTPPGSPGYIAPEVVRGQEYDQAADLYSFGVLSWVVLTGGLVSGAGDVAESLEPLPPCAKMAHNWDYSALGENCKLLRACVEEPQANAARPLPDDHTKALVKALTCEAAAERPCIDEIRRHPALRRLRLPRPSASAVEVDDWLSSSPASDTASEGGSFVGRLAADTSAPASSVAAPPAQPAAPVPAAPLPAPGAEPAPAPAAAGVPGASVSPVDEAAASQGPVSAEEPREAAADHKAAPHRTADFPQGEVRPPLPDAELREAAAPAAEAREAPPEAELRAAAELPEAPLRPPAAVARKCRTCWLAPATWDARFCEMCGEELL